MDIKLLEAVARTAEPAILRAPEDIAVFLDLLSRRLVTGAVQTQADGQRYAAVHGLTADGRALLALARCTQRRSGNRTPSE